MEANMTDIESTLVTPHCMASITKQELAELPAASYAGTIVVIDKDDMVDAAVADLAKESVIGFDTETKPSFKRGQTNTVSLLQLSTHDTCYLFRLKHLGSHPELVHLLENPNILKIGVSIHDDFHNLQKICKLEPAGFVDLQAYVKKYDILDNSLSRIYAILFGKRISKGQRLSNWEANTLTRHQQEYASLDALACIQIYDYLNAHGFDATESPYYRPIALPGAPAPVVQQ